MSADNEALVRRYYEEVFSKKNLAFVDQLVSATFVYGDPSVPEEVRGPQAVKQAISTMFEGFPDLQFTIEDIIAEGDKVVIRYSSSGIHKGSYAGVAATGKQINVTGTLTYRIVKGRFEEEWAHRDALGLRQQLGLVPIVQSR
jgi:steroid delta-isomerase-like uncharacterized protein